MPRKSSVLLAALLVGLMGGCATSDTTVVGAANQEAAPAVADTLQISDISLPPGARLDAGNTLMIGSGSRWFGRVAFKSDMGPVQVFNHLNTGMTGLGWRLISSMQSKTSLLVFQRGERVAMVQVEPQSLGGSLVTVNVSLQEPARPDTVQVK